MSINVSPLEMVFFFAFEVNEKSLFFCSELLPQEPIKIVKIMSVRNLKRRIAAIVFLSKLFI